MKFGSRARRQTAAMVAATVAAGSVPFVLPLMQADASSMTVSTLMTVCNSGAPLPREAVSYQTYVSDVSSDDLTSPSLFLAPGDIKPIVSTPGAGWEPGRFYTRVGSTYQYPVVPDPDGVLNPRWGTVISNPALSGLALPAAAASEDANGNGCADPGEDTNSDGRVSLGQTVTMSIIEQRVRGIFTNRARAGLPLLGSPSGPSDILHLLVDGERTLSTPDMPVPTDGGSESPFDWSSAEDGPYPPPNLLGADKSSQTLWDTVRPAINEGATDVNSDGVITNDPGIDIPTLFPGSAAAPAPAVIGTVTAANTTITNTAGSASRIVPVAVQLDPAATSGTGIKAENVDVVAMVQVTERFANVPSTTGSNFTVNVRTTASPNDANGDGTVGDNNQAFAGSAVTDNAIISGLPAGATATVEFHVFNLTDDAACAAPIEFAPGVTIDATSGLDDGVNTGLAALNVPASAVGDRLGYRERIVSVELADGTIVNNASTAFSACGETAESFDVSGPSAVTQVSASSSSAGATITDSITISDLGPAATAAVEFQVFNLTDDATCAAPLDFDGTGPLGVTVTENGLAAGTTAGLADLIVPAAAAGDRLGYRERIVSITVGGSTAPFAGAWSACGEATESFDVVAPTAATQVSATSVDVPGDISDSITITGLAAGATATAEFQIFDLDNDAACAAPLSLFGGSATATVSGLVNGSNSNVVTVTVPASLAGRRLGFRERIVAITAAGITSPFAGTWSACGETTESFDVNDLPVYDLALVKVVNDADGIVEPSDTISWTVRVTNQGNMNSGAYTVTDRLPSGLAFDSADNGGTHAGGVITWNLTNLAPGASIDLTYTSTIVDPLLATYRNWAEISSDSGDDEDSTPDSNTGSDSTLPNDSYTDIDDLDASVLDNFDATDSDDNDDAEITVNDVYDLALVKVTPVSTVALGADVTWTIRVQNQGNLPSGEVTVTDRIPAGMSFVSASNAGTESAGVITWTIANIPVNGFVDLTFVGAVVDPAAGPFRNWAEISSDSGADEDSTPDTNTGSNQTLPNDDYVGIDDLTLATVDQVTGDSDDNDDAVVNVDVPTVATQVSTNAANIGDTVTDTVIVSGLGTGIVANVELELFDQGTGAPVCSTPLASFDLDAVANGSLAGQGSFVVPATAAGHNLGYRERIVSVTNTVTGRTVVLNSGTNGWSACGETTETFAVGIPAAVTQVAAPSIAPGAVMTDSITISDLGPAATAAVEFQVFNLTDDATCAAPLDFDGTGPLGITVTENGLAAGTTAGLADLIVPAAAAGDRLGYRERIVSITVGGSTAPFAGAWSACGEATESFDVVAPTAATQVSAVTPAEVGDTVTDSITITGLGAGATATVEFEVFNLTEDPTCAAPLTLFGGSDTATVSGLVNGMNVDATSIVVPSSASADEMGFRERIVAITAAGITSPFAGTWSACGEATESFDVNFQAIYDLALVKVVNDADGRVEPSDTISWTVRVTNQGNVNSGAYTVTDRLPSGLAFDSADNGGTHAGGVITWNLTNLAPGASIDLTYTSTIVDPLLATYRNWAEISSDSADDYDRPADGVDVFDEDSTPDSNTGSDSTLPNDSYTDIDDLDASVLDNFDATDSDDNDDAEITVNDVYDLALVKVTPVSTVALGADVTWTIRVQNQGNLPSGEVTVTDRIPAGMSFVSASNAGTESAGVITWTIANIPVNGFVDLTFVGAVVDPAAGPFRNWAEISSDSGADEDSTPDTNTGSNQTLPNDDYVGIDNLTFATVDQVTGDSDDNDDAVVNVAVPTVATQVSTNAANIGDTVTDTVIVSGLGTGIVANVELELFDQGTGAPVCSTPLASFDLDAVANGSLAGQGSFVVPAAAAGHNLGYRERIVSVTNTVTGRTVVLNSGTNGWSACGETTETFAVGVPAVVTQVSNHAPGLGALVTDSVTVSGLGSAATATVELQLFDRTVDPNCTTPIVLDNGATVASVSGLSNGTVSGLAPYTVKSTDSSRRFSYTERIVSVNVAGVEAAAAAPISGWSACGVEAESFAVAVAVNSIPRTGSELGRILFAAAGMHLFGLGFAVSALMMRRRRRQAESV